VAFEERLCGNPEDVVDGVDGDDHVRAHAGAQLRRGLIQRNTGFELAIPRRAGGAADKFYVAGEFTAGESDNADGDRLALVRVAAIELADAGGDFPALEVGDLRYGLAAADVIAELIRRQRHAPVDHVLITILLDVDVAAGLGFERHVLDILAGDI